MANPGKSSAQQLEAALLLERFKGFKAILDSLSSNIESKREALSGATSYEDLLRRLGYRLVLTNQIHVNDAFSRIGVTHGIRAVLPYYDIPTQSSLPTLINFDASVTATPKSVAFFGGLLTDLKSQMLNA